MCPGVNCEGDEDHVFIQFADDIFTMNKRSGVGVGGGVCAYVQAFVMLKIVVCIGSDCIENDFRLVGLGCRWGPGDVDVCPNGGVWAVVTRCGIGIERYVEGSCRGVGAEMEQWFIRHGCGWV